MLSLKGEKKMEYKHVQRSGADDEDGGDHEKSVGEMHV